jgi:ABC-type uncharacterized transport system substrate-binding protein
MKIFGRIMLVNVALIIFLSFSAGFAADKKEYSTSPPVTITKKWRIGYLEGGPYQEYPMVLAALVEGLSELGWIKATGIPREVKADTGKLWAWLATNVRSKYIQFVADAYYSTNWDREFRNEHKKRVLKRLTENRDIDLMIAMGTWAGQDLANNEHSVPTIVVGASDPLAARIIKSIEDSGYDHVHARVDPTRFERQVRAFHDVIEFTKLGVCFIDTLDGRSYAGLESIEKVARERNFEIVECPVITESGKTEAQEPVMLKCVQELAPKIDAYYITMQSAVNAKTLPGILSEMNAHKVPTFSQFGVDEVRQGVLLSVATPNFIGLGRFHAETIAKIINGAKPRDLNQIYEELVKIAFNAAAAMIIGMDPETYNLLMDTAEEIYEEIETEE